MPGPHPSPLRPGETVDTRMDQSVILPDGSQFRIFRHSSRSRLSWLRTRDDTSEDTSEEASGEVSKEEQYESFVSSDEGASHPSPPSPGLPPAPGPAPWPAPGPAPPRPPSDPEDTPRRSIGIGQRIGRLGKRLGKVQERWLVGKPHAPVPVLVSPAILVPRSPAPQGNRTPTPPARPGERAETSSTSSGSQSDRALSSRASLEQAAPSTSSPTLDRRARRPPDRYQAQLPSPATRTGKDGKGQKKRRT